MSENAAEEPKQKKRHGARWVAAAVAVLLLGAAGVTLADNAGDEDKDAKPAATTDADDTAAEPTDAEPTTGLPLPSASEPTEADAGAATESPATPAPTVDPSPAGPPPSAVDGGL